MITMTRSVVITFLLVHWFSMAQMKNSDKSCRLVTKPSGLFIVCDSQNPKSDENPMNPKPSKINGRSNQIKLKDKKRRRRYRLTIKCEDLTTPWTNISKPLEVMIKLFNIECPMNSFLRGMGLNTNDTHAQTRYKCCVLE